MGSGRFELAERENELGMQLIRAERHPNARATAAQLLENYYFLGYFKEFLENPWESLGILILVGIHGFPPKSTFSPKSAL